MGGIKIKNLKDILEFLFLYPKNIEGLNLGKIELYKYGNVYCIIQRYNGREYALPFHITNLGFVLYATRRKDDLIGGGIIDLSITYPVLSGVLDKKSIKVQVLKENVDANRYLKYFLWVLKVINQNKEKIKKYDPLGIEEFRLDDEFSELFETEIV